MVPCCQSFSSSESAPVSDVINDGLQPFPEGQKNTNYIIRISPLGPAFDLDDLTSVPTPLSKSKQDHRSPGAERTPTMAHRLVQSSTFRSHQTSLLQVKNTMVVTP